MVRSAGGAPSRSLYLLERMGTGLWDASTAPAALQAGRRRQRHPWRRASPPIDIRLSADRPMRFPSVPFTPRTPVVKGVFPSPLRRQKDGEAASVATRLDGYHPEDPAVSLDSFIDGAARIFIIV